MWQHLLLFSLLSSTVLCLDARWKLLWSDDFTGSKLDTTKWNARTQKGLGAHEFQYYLEDHVAVSDGKLVITTEVNPKNTTATQAINENYLSGWIDSLGKFSSTYGRYEMNAKMPIGVGVWPAFWMLSDYLCWPVGAEFDIVEYRGYQNFTSWGTYHFAEQCGADLHNGSYITQAADLSKGYHTYAIEWFPGNATWYLDGVPYTTIVNTSFYGGKPFKMDVSPHFFILNTAVGTYSIPYGQSEANITRSIFPQYYYVDYVRAYTWDPCPGGCGHGCCDTVTGTCKCDGGYKGAHCEYNAIPLDATGKYVADFSKGTFANNATVINGVLTLTANLSGCPNGTGVCVVPSWLAPGAFDKGNFTFVAKSSPVRGFAFNAMGRNVASNGYYEFIATQMICGSRKWTGTYTNAYYYKSVYVNNTFDNYQDFHTYSFIWETDRVSFYVDGVFQNIAWGAATSPINFQFQIIGNSAYYGVINGSQVPTSVYIKSFTWTPLNGKAVCAAATTTTTTASSTTKASTTTAATTATTSSGSTTTTTKATTSSGSTTTTTKASTSSTTATSTAPIATTEDTATSSPTSSPPSSTTTNPSGSPIASSDSVVIAPFVALITLMSLLAL